MQSTIEPELLQTFVAIAETGSFTDAAKRVYRTQSAVSMQIKRLEELLGHPVFTRNGRAVRLTYHGEILLGHARRILKANQEAIAAFVQPELQGTVSLGAVDEYAIAFLPAVLARFAQNHPLVHVEVVCDTTRNLVERLDSDSLDFALITHDQGANSGTILLEEPMMWVTLAAQTAHRQDPVPLATFREGCFFRQCAIDSLAKQGRPYRLAYSSVSLTGVLAALRAGIAVSVLPRSNVTGDLRILDERDGFPVLSSYQIALRRSRIALSPIHDSLEQHIVEKFRPGLVRPDAWGAAAVGSDYL